MLSAKAVQDLLHLRSDASDVVSVYIEFDAPASAKTLRTLAQQAAGAGGGAGQRDIDRALRWIGEFKPGAHRAAAVFACSRLGLWQPCPLPEPVKTQVRVSTQAYLTPLLNQLDGHRRYGVAVGGGPKPRFFEVFLGLVEEREPQPLLGAASPPPGALNEDNAGLKALADGLLTLWRREALERAVISVPPAWEGKLLPQLHGTLQNAVILDPALGPDAGPAAVLERVVTGERESRKVRESVLVHRLMDSVRASAMGVTGLAETIRAVERGQARLLLVRDGLAKMGRVCPGCGRLTLSGKRCHGCYQNTEPLFDVVTELCQQALDQGCEVVRLLHEARLDSFGGIGAELKFKAEA